MPTPCGHTIDLNPSIIATLFGDFGGLVVLVSILRHFRNVRKLVGATTVFLLLSLSFFLLFVLFKFMFMVESEQFSMHLFGGKRRYWRLMVWAGWLWSNQGQIVGSTFTEAENRCA